MGAQSRDAKGRQESDRVGDAALTMQGGELLHIIQDRVNFGLKVVASNEFEEKGLLVPKRVPIWLARFVLSRAPYHKVVILDEESRGFCDGGIP